MVQTFSEIVDHFQAFLRPIPPKPVKSVPMTDGTIAASEPPPMVCPSSIESETTAILAFLPLVANLCSSIRSHPGHNGTENFESVLRLEHMYGSARLYWTRKISTMHHESVLKSFYWLGSLSEITDDVPSNTLLKRLCDSTRSAVSTLCVRLARHARDRRIFSIFSRSFNICRTLRVLNLDYNESVDHNVSAGKECRGI